MVWPAPGRGTCPVALLSGPSFGRSPEVINRWAQELNLVQTLSGSIAGGGAENGCFCFSKPSLLQALPLMTDCQCQLWKLSAPGTALQGLKQALQGLNQALTTPR
jgi:hypothetical protein